MRTYNAIYGQVIFYKTNTKYFLPHMSTCILTTCDPDPGIQAEGGGVQAEVIEMRLIWFQKLQNNPVKAPLLNIHIAYVCKITRDTQKSIFQ